MIGSATFTLACALALASAPTTRTSTTVPATEGRSCTAYLFAAPGARDAALVVDLAGSGTATMARGADENLPLAAPFVADGTVALLTIEKPGIGADDAGAVVVDAAVYDAYTPADLVACTAHAIAWASSQPATGPHAPIVLHGHSEGALVVVRAALRLVDAPVDDVERAAASRLRALLLDGAPLAAPREIEEAQLGVLGRARQRFALWRDDDDAIRKLTGVGIKTLRAFLDAPPLSDDVRALAHAAPALRIAFFHGLDDTSIPPAPLLALARAPVAPGTAPLTVRLYAAGHNLNADALRDMRLWLRSACADDVASW